MRILLRISRGLSAVAIMALGFVAAPAVYGQIAPSCRNVIPATTGVAAYRCASCSAETHRDSSVVYLFDAEPVVTEVVPPSGAGRVQVGDVIVSVNGRPITTREASVLLSNPPVGTLRLGIRRNGGHVNLDFVVPLRCTGPGGVASVSARGVRFTNALSTLSTSDVSRISWQDGVIQLLKEDAGVGRDVLRSVDSAADRASFRFYYAQSTRRMDAALRATDSALKALDSSVARMHALIADTTLVARRQMLASQSNQLEAAYARLRTLLADQYARIASMTSSLGFAVACVESCSRQSDAGGNAYWRYAAYPVVSSVREQGPAERAGLRVGDRLSAIDDTSILTSEGAIAFQRAADRDAGTLRLTVLRDGRPVTLTIQVGGR